MHLTELKALHVSALLEMAAGLEIENTQRMRKQELMFSILKKRAKGGETIFGDGVLEVLPDGFGFLRSPESSYLASPDDIYIYPAQIRRFNLRTGQTRERVIDDIGDDTVNADLVHGHYLFRLEARSLDDIRALGNNDEEDTRRFATVARVSEVGHGLYRTLAQPAVRAMASKPAAELARDLHPNRLRFAALSDRNPLMQPVKALAEAVRADRRPVSPDNPLLTA